MCYGICYEQVLMMMRVTKMMLLSVWGPTEREMTWMRRATLENTSDKEVGLLVGF